MMKKYFIIVLLIAFLLTACSQQQAKIDRNTKETTAATELIPTEIQKDNESVPTEAETTIPPTVADDLNYYEMYLKVKEDLHNDRHDSSWGNSFAVGGPEHTKEWKSTDGKISFVLDTKLGPYGSTTSTIESPPKYTVNGIDYQNMELNLAPIGFSIDEEPCFSLMKWSPGVKCTIILSGPFEYDHDEQSFTVTADSAILYAPDVPGVRYSEAEKMTVDEWNEKYGDPDVPYYHEGEKVTFKMVR